MFRPFKALRPEARYACDVISPPYDVLSSAEACELAKGRPLSFLHISKPEIDLEPDVDQYAQAVYDKGAENLKKLVDGKILVRDEEPGYYVYRIIMGEHVQTGIAGLASARAYKAGKIKRHEFTMPVKEDDRFNNIKTLNAQTGPVLLTHRESPELEAVIAKVTAAEPLYNVLGPYDTRHEIWRISDKDTLFAIHHAFDTLGEMFIADGHHRMAAGTRVCEWKQSQNPEANKAKYDGILAVAFPARDMQVMQYNRLIRDLNGMSIPELIAGIEANGFAVEESPYPVDPKRKLEFGMYVGGQWYRLEYLNPVDVSNVLNRLDVSILSKQVFDKVFDIKDLRTDRRIAFVGGIRGVKGLASLVNKGEYKVGFSLCPTPIYDMIDVTMAGEIMPPKSTWFEPKLADGLLSNVLED